MEKSEQTKKEEILLKELKIFTTRIERAIYELYLNEDIRNAKIKFGEYKPEFHAYLLDVETIGRVDKNDKMMSFIKLIQDMR